MLEEQDLKSCYLCYRSLMRKKINSKNYYDWTVKIKAQDSRFNVQGSKFICGQRSFIK